MDGSPFLFGLDGLNLFYRSCSQVDSPDDRALRMNIDKYVTDLKTQDLVKKNHITYVLQLDAASKVRDRSTFHAFYSSDFWTGIQNIAPDTPGFKLLYSKGDIRLYKLTDI